MGFLAAYLMRGRMQAIIAASTLALLSLLFPPFSVILFGIMSIAAVGLVTLRKGAFEGGLVLIASTAAAAVLGGLAIGNYPLVIGYGMGLWVPVFLIATLLRMGGRLSLSLEVATLLGMLGVAGFYIIHDAPAAVWLENMKHMLEPMLEAAPPEIDRAEIERRLETVSHYMTGSAAAVAVAVWTMGLVLARWWQSLLYNPGGFRDEYLALRIGSKAAYGCLVFIVLGVTGALPELSWNILQPAGVLYLMAGTAVCHCLLSVARGKRFLLPAMYILMFFIPYVQLLVALVGFSDTWLDLRRRVSG